MGDYMKKFSVVLLLSLAAKLCHAQSCNPTDSSALKYFALEIVFSGTAFQSWVDGTDCCTWAGVTCNGAGRVEQLTVVAADVPAPPPTGSPYVVGSGLGDLAALKNLTMINIAYNGILPTTFGGLSNLQILNLDGCNVAGNMPQELCKLSNLVTLILKGNLLTGSVPGCITSLPALTLLDLTGNSFSGNVPSKP